MATGTEGAQRVDLAEVATTEWESEQRKKETAMRDLIERQLKSEWHQSKTHLECRLANLQSLLNCERDRNLMMETVLAEEREATNIANAECFTKEKEISELLNSRIDMEKQLSDGRDATARLEKEKERLKEVFDQTKEQRDLLLQTNDKAREQIHQKSEVEKKLCAFRVEKNKLNRDLSAHLQTLQETRESMKQAFVVMEKQNTRLDSIQESRKKIVEDAERKALETFGEKNQLRKRKFTAMRAENHKLKQEVILNKEQNDRAKATMQSSHQQIVDKEVQIALAKAQDIFENALEDEKLKRLCQICYTYPKDTILLPCLHLLNCFNCLDKSRKVHNRCPTCKSSISGVLKCDISMD